MNMTIDDIARVCGLSRATVSRVLQNSPKVSEKSRRIVEKTIKETGYQPNQMAQSLAQGYSNTVALIIGNISSVAQIEIAKAIQKGLYEQGLMTWLCNSDYNTALCDAYLDSAIASRLAGAVLVTADASTQKLRQTIHSGMPIVMVHRQNFDLNCDSVLGNDQKAAYQAVNHLVNAGHRKIILLGSLQTMITSRNAYLGYWAALEANGIPFHENQVYEINITSYSDALKTRIPFDAADLFSAHPDVTAVICSCNEIAVEFFIQCRRIGIHVPHDLSLVCLDPVRENWLPDVPFCTFGADQQSLGETAVSQILSRIQARKFDKRGDPAAPNSNIVLDPVFWEGSSVRKLN